jgi:predicted TIM-barrel fold metal-dependent hydrolase
MTDVSSDTAIAAGLARGAGAQTLLIDTDVHEYLKSGTSLLPYLDPAWQHYITQYGWDMTGFPSENPYTMPSTDGITARAEWVLPDRTMATDVAAMRAHLLDGVGVTHAILNGFFQPSAQRGQYEFATALASAYNDWQIHEWLEKEPRLRGSVHVVAHDPKSAAREIDRVAEHPQIVQAFLPTVTNLEYGDPHYRPIFEAAARTRLVVAFHHGPHTRTVLGYPRYFIQWHTTAAPQAAMNQLLSLICNGLFDHLPELKVAFLETGIAWVPWFMWRLDQQYRELRLEVPWVKRLPSDHMRDSVRISTQPATDVTPTNFAKLVEMTDSDRMFMFSSDYPHYDADGADRWLPGLPEGLGRRIRYQNALETYAKLA